jgi:23S rRNA (adenine2503-C2)-methyltransferase
MNEIAGPALQPLANRAGLHGKQNLLDLDRAGLERFFEEFSARNATVPIR